MYSKKIVLSVIIDLIVVIVLTVTFIIVAFSASGLIFNRMWLKLIAVLLPVVYIAVSLLFRNSVGWLATKKGKFAKALKLTFANVIDFTVILLFTLLADFALHSLFYYDIFVLLLVIFATYYFTTVLCNGVTFGKWCFGIKFNTGNRAAILKYTIAKIVSVIVFPVILFRILGIVDPFALFMNIVLCFVIFHVFSVIVSKTTIWAYFAKISYEWQNVKLKFVLGKLACLSLIILIGFSSLKFINNKIHTQERQPFINMWTDTETKGHFFGFTYPFKFKKFPNIRDVKTYTDFLKTQNQSPKEYILGLFEKYDIVILQEHYHGESTQWDMIFDIVSDTTFINNVGNIFTEYGYVGQQQKVDKFLTTVFPNDTILEKETACLMYFMSGAFYYFVKNMNLLNSELPDSLKIKLHLCCAQIDCEDIVAFGETKAKINDNRDSLMAQTAIDWYNEQSVAGKRPKCLVVTNYRHAFGYAGGEAVI